MLTIPRRLALRPRPRRRSAGSAPAARVVELALQGMTVSQIAHATALSREAVELHLRRTPDFGRRQIRPRADDPAGAPAQPTDWRALAGSMQVVEAKRLSNLVLRHS